MKYFDWDPKKSGQLRDEREVGFEEVMLAIEEGNLLDVIEHHNKKKYPRQKLFIVNIHNYAYLIPFVEDEKKYFLKTIFPSRKMTLKYVIKKKT
jgi:hypothetical protein